MNPAVQRIALIPGDGIGREVMPEGERVLAVAAKRFDLNLALTPIEWASCARSATAAGRP